MGRREADTAGRSSRQPEIGGDPTIGVGGHARSKAQTERPEIEEDEGGELEALDPFGAQVAAI